MAKQLSEIEKFFIEAHADVLTVDQLADKLGRTAPTIRTFLKKVKKKAPKPKKKSPAQTQGDKMLARQSGVVIMTGEASEQFDATKLSNKLKSKKYNNAVQSIRN